MKHHNSRNSSVPPKIGFGRRNLFLKRHSESLSLQEANNRSLRRSLEKMGKELRAANAHIREMEKAHDERSAEGEALRKIGETTGSLFDLEEMLRAVAGIAVQVTGTDSSQVYLFNEAHDTLVLRAVDAESEPDEIVGKLRLKVGEGLTGWVAKNKEAVALDHDAQHDARFKFVPELQEDKYQSILSVPLVYRNDVLGVINVRTVKTHQYTQTQVRLLQSIAAQISGAVENSRQYRKLEKRTSQLSALSEVSKTITSDLYLEEILQLIVAATAKTMSFKICTLMLLDEEKQELVIKATQSKSKDYVKKANIKVGDSVAGRAVSEGRTITVHDLKNSQEYASPEIARKEGLSSMAAVPLMVKNKKIGVLNCYTEKPHNFTEEEISLLTALGNHAAIAIEHAKLMVKSAIIQEMHHRVKNNLQQVASLLRLQMHYAGERTVEQVITESLNRILAIASVHELLAREDLDIISVKKIAESIVQATGQSIIAPGKHIRMTVDGPDILLPSSQATSIALILNELVQNAVEHGFGPGFDDGSISIRLHEDPRQVELLVTNDGEPLPPGFDIKKTDSLGLQIVESLVNGDLQGKFTLTNVDECTVAAVIFGK
ncbi:MAG: Signal transduction histidine kinase [Capsulimonas sp.]|jgi:two-component sensor histidine kinase|nr:Signal transduction histidine kinase [Capsulimonas sp.]